MSDESIRELERAARSAPRDGRARLAFAQALARAGRKREALDALDLASVPEEDFAELKAFSDALWHEEIASFRMAWEIRATNPSHVARDASDELVGWRERATPPFQWRIASLVTGAVLLATEGGGIIRGRGRLSVLDDGVRPTAYRTCEPGSVGDWIGIPDWPGRVGVLQDDPEGALVLLSNNSVHEWPSLGLVRRLRPDSFVAADWERRCLLERDGRGAWQVVPLGPREGWAIKSRSLVLKSLGCGLLSGGDRAVYDLDRRRWIELARHGEYPFLSLSRDGRGLRHIVGAGDSPRGARVELNRERGVVRGAFGREVTRARFDHLAWHPVADVWLCAAVKGRDYEQRTIDGAVLLTVPGQGCWILGGHAFLVTWPDRLQLWRAP